MKKQIRNKKGITLIALVITIIILLILAGVALSLVTGENGILKRATNAVDKHNEAVAKEQVELLIADYQTEWYEEKYVNGTETRSQREYIAEKLKGATTNDYFVQTETSEDGIINVYVSDDSGNIICSGILQEDSVIKWNEKLEGIVINYTLNPNGYTNGNITLTLNVSSTEGNITNIESTLNKNEDGTYTITENGSYEFTATDSTGATKKKTIEIQKIDRTLPQDFTISMEIIEGDKLKIIANAEDGDATAESVKSGIEKYEYYINGIKYETTEESYTITIEDGKKYENIYVIAYDKAGNKKESTNRLQMGKIIYVSTDGNDTSGNGTKQNSYASVEKAIEVAESGTSIYIKEGIYTLSGMKGYFVDEYHGWTAENFRKNRFI